jgi:ribosomal protein S14
VPYRPQSLSGDANARMFANRQATKETGNRAGCALNGNEQTTPAVFKISKIRFREQTLKKELCC